MLADSNYLAIGMGGEGPALRVDETLNQGRTYRSETYENDALTGEESLLQNEFEVQDFEAYIF